MASPSLSLTQHHYSGRSAALSTTVYDGDGALAKRSRRRSTTYSLTTEYVVVEIDMMRRWPLIRARP